MGWRQHPLWPPLKRLLVLLGVCLLALQMWFALRIAAMLLIDPQSTAFQRSEAWRLLSTQGRIVWAQEWRDRNQLGEPIARAVIASEDGGFVDHGGVDWDALENAWSRNQRAEARAEKRNAQVERRAAQASAKAASALRARRVEPKLIGGSTISQQLAKNLFLSGERTALRKAQEVVLTYLLEAMLGKRRILEIYLNSVEWGEGLFGAQAAAQYYFHSDALRLGNASAARLAVMLPAPKRFERTPASPYLLGRAATVSARMGDVELP